MKRKCKARVGLPAVQAGCVWLFLFWLSLKTIIEQKLWPFPNLLLIGATIYYD